VRSAFFLALLALTPHDEYRAWKGLDWDVLNQLYEKDLIANPRNKAKSILFTLEGWTRAIEACERLFKKNRCKVVPYFIATLAASAKNPLRV
jgi:hypothetical protein